MALYTVSSGQQIKSADIDQVVNVLTGADTATTISPAKQGVGSNTSGRFIGILTTKGVPTTGTWLTGDYGFDPNGMPIVCTVGGSPGTWRMGSSAFYQARMYQSFSQAVPVGGWNSLAFDQVSYDYNGNVTPGTQSPLAGAYYTCPFAGFYRVDVSVLASGSTAAAFYVGLNKGAGEVSRIATIASVTSHEAIGSQRILAAAGDTFQAVMQASATGWTTTAGSAFCHMEIEFRGS